MPLPALAALLLLASARPAPVPTSTFADAPASPREFGGFLLGQYASAVEAKLGKPARTGTDTDGETLWFYDLAPGRKDTARLGPGTTLVFSMNGNERPTITMIEVNGQPLKSAPTILGISLGTSKADLLKALGPADTTGERKEAPGEVFDWETRNYYVETDASGKVDCLQVVENNAGYPPAGDTKPDLEGFRKALESRDRDTIFDWLASDIDIYTKTDETVTFVGSPREDIHNEESMISRYLFGGTGSARDLLTASLVSSAELEQDDEDKSQWTSTFPEGGKIVDIVWRFDAGRWRVWEIDLNPDESQTRH